MPKNDALVRTFFAFHRGTLRGKYGDQSWVKTTPSFICGAGWIDWETLGCLGVTGS